MKTVGIIGGFGPETTAKFQLKVVALCRAQKSKVRPAMLIWNTPVTHQMEKDLITGRGNGKVFLPFLIEAAQKLEKAGADFLVLPCNTLHIFIGQIQKSVHIPVLNIINETAADLVSKNVNAVTLLATSKTVRNHLHQNKLQSVGIRVKTPPKARQKALDKIIVRAINGNRQANLDSLIKPDRDVLLACTDLQLLIPSSKHIHDTLNILAKATTREILK